MATSFASTRPVTAGSGFESLLVSFREFIHQPSAVGSAFPASRYLVDAMLEPIDFTKTRVVVEYGPGSGPVTRALLARMPKDSALVAIDLSPRFTRHLRDAIDDPRLVAVTGCATSAGAVVDRLGLGPVDLIVTGIPFSTIDGPVGARIMDSSAALLSEHGQLIAYQMRDAVAVLLGSRFDQIDHSREWRNIPPCHIYRASRPVR